MGSETGRKVLLAAKLFPLGKDIEKMIKMQVFIYNFQKNSSIFIYQVKGKTGCGRSHWQHLIQTAQCLKPNDLV